MRRGGGLSGIGKTEQCCAHTSTEFQNIYRILRKGDNHGDKKCYPYICMLFGSSMLNGAELPRWQRVYAISFDDRARVRWRDGSFPGQYGCFADCAGSRNVEIDSVLDTLFSCRCCRGVARLVGVCVLRNITAARTAWREKACIGSHKLSNQDQRHRRETAVGASAVRRDMKEEGATMKADEKGKS